MTELRDRVVAALDTAIAGLDRVGAVPDVRAELDRSRSRIREPLQVAVVGRVSSGKSTLVNALIGERLAPTGLLELTFNVNRLRRGKPPSVTARFAGGETLELPSREALEQHVALRRDAGGDNRAELRRVEWVDIVLDSERLELFDLIDTPGIDSYYGDEEAKTRSVLGVGADEVRDSSLRAAADADALIVVLDDRLASAVDERLLMDFRGPGLAGRTPVTTLGVQTKVENLWDPDTAPDPMVVARRDGGRLIRNGVMRELVFELVPVCSLVGQFATGMDEDDLGDLVALADGADPVRLTDLVTHGEVFTGADLPLDPGRRAQLHRELSGYGLHLACGLIRDGARSREDLSAALVERSGLDDVRRRITDHFGHRADLIRLSAVRELVRPLPWKRGPDLPPEQRLALLDAVGVVERLERSEHGVAELGVLQRLFSGDLAVDPSVQDEVERLLGERGRSVAARLGLREHTGLEELEGCTTAAHERWVLRSPVTDRTARAVLRDTAKGLARAVAEARAKVERPW